MHEISKSQNVDKFDNTWSVKNYLTGTFSTKSLPLLFVPIEMECFKLLMYLELTIK